MAIDEKISDEKLREELKTNPKYHLYFGITEIADKALTAAEVDDKGEAREWIESKLTNEKLYNKFYQMGCHHKYLCCTSDPEEKKKLSCKENKCDPQPKSCVEKIFPEHKKKGAHLRVTEGSLSLVKSFMMKELVYQIGREYLQVGQAEQLNAEKLGEIKGKLSTAAIQTTISGGVEGATHVSQPQQFSSISKEAEEAEKAEEAENPEEAEELEEDESPEERIMRSLTELEGAVRHHR